VYFLYPALILPLFKPKANVCTQKMGWVLTMPLLAKCPCCTIHLLSLPFTTTCLFIWHIRLSGQTWTWASGLELR
jgi:hypothetical protein